MREYTWMRNDITLFIRICTSFYSFARNWSFCVCVRQTDVARQIAILTDNFFLLTIRRCVIFKNPLSTSSTSRLGLLNWRPLRAVALSGVFSLTTSWLSLWPSLSPTDSTAAGICIYYFIMPTYLRLDHMNFCLFTQVHLWLTARSRVNMLQYYISSTLQLYLTIYHNIIHFVTKPQILNIINNNYHQFL